MVSSTASFFRSASHDGIFQVHVVAWEARNSLWVESPRIVDTRTGETLFRFLDESWSLDRTEWTCDDQVQLSLRKFPGDHTPSQLVCSIDCNGRRATIESSAAIPLDQLEPLLERLLSWASRPSP
ncbi:MAG: hypothetical protein RLZZ618_2665 [Pseudomonadota bacterium]|jgi:hypothetical protein